MPTYSGPKRAGKENLIFALDAADKNSYPGSGTAWTNLAGPYNGTLTNGPTYSSENGGLIVFDGTDDYIQTALVMPSPSTVSTTYEVSFFPLVDSYNYRGLIGYSGYPNNGFSLGLHYGSSLFLQSFNGGSPNISYLSSVIDLTIPHTVCATLNGRNLAIYSNGILLNSTTISFDIAASAGSIKIGGYVQGGWGSSNIRLYQARVYNKALTPQEILQNYNATKTRFVL